MSSYLSILLTILAVIVAVYFIVNKRNTTFIFFLTGLILLFITTALSGQSILGEDTTGNIFLDVIAYIGTVTKKQLGGIGANLMIVSAFSSFMNYIGASDKLVRSVTGPLSKFNNPYIVMIIIYLISTVLKTMITSHAGLSILLMATAYPILIELGINKKSAASAILLGGAIDWWTNDNAVVFAAELSNMNVFDYVTSLQWQPALATIATISISIGILFKYWDKKESQLNNKVDNDIELNSDTYIKDGSNLPGFYTLFPSMPLVLILFSNLFTDLNLDIFTANVIAIIFIFIIESIRNKSTLIIVDQMKFIFSSMGRTFATTVTLIIGAGYFANALIDLGGINILFDMLANFQGAKIITLVALTALCFFGVMVLGTGNATFFAVGPLVPELSTKIGLSTYPLIVPMQLSASIGRGISPVSSAMISVSGMAGVSVVDIIKRTFIPTILGQLANIIVSYLMFM